MIRVCPFSAPLPILTHPLDVVFRDYSRRSSVPLWCRAVLVDLGGSSFLFALGDIPTECLGGSFSPPLERFFCRRIPPPFPPPPPNPTPPLRFYRHNQLAPSEGATFLKFFPPRLDFKYLSRTSFYGSGLWRAVLTLLSRLGFLRFLRALFL